MSWRKVLREMAAAEKRTGYTYGDCMSILKQLGFVCVTKSGTSHRRWRLERTGYPPVYIGLVDRGKAEIKRFYVDTMIAVLQDNALMPPTENDRDDA